MRKILITFDGSHYSEGAMDFARLLNKKDRILLTGAFLPQVDFANLWSYSGGGTAGNLFIPLVEDEDAQAVKQNIRRFENYCISNDIEYRVHKDFLDFALPELKRESRFADLLIIGSETFYQQSGTEALNEYLKEALHKVECPVLVVPEKFDFPQRNILSYDGSEASVYAIKQFIYLFPEFAKNVTLLVYAKEKGEETLPDELNIQELAARHFKDLSLFKLEANPKKYFANWLTEKKGAILVCGAFGRSDLSRLFHKSFVTDVIRDHRLPVFIAHK